MILLVASCWVPCDGLATRPGGSSNVRSHLMQHKPELSAGLMNLKSPATTYVQDWTQLQFLRFFA